MTKEELIKQLEAAKEIGLGDPEMAHGMADNAVMEFLSSEGHQDAVDIFNSIEMWYA